MLMDKYVINRTIAEKLFGLKDGVDYEEVPDYFTHRGFDSIVEKLTENGYTVRATLRKEYANVSILRYGKLLADSDGTGIVDATALATYEYLELLK